MLFKLNVLIVNMVFSIFDKPVFMLFLFEQVSKINALVLVAFDEVGAPPCIGFFCCVVSVIGHSHYHTVVSTQSRCNVVAHLVEPFSSVNILWSVR